ncbi:MAG TPA: DUF3459 domain-containing protein, partial [Candidatus Acidoferrum sp.]|nr:DUF3459 domain-containing protein [Candidatus Acidoferrum sp.]
WKPEDTADPQAPETFARSKLNWDEISKSPHAEILDWHKKLIQLRRGEPDLSDGDLQNVRTNYNEQNRWLVLERGRISVVCNFAARPFRIPVRAGHHEVLLASEDIHVTDGFANFPAESVAVLKLV